MNFKNRVAMVTGAAQGIGKATALILAQYGSDIAVSDIKEQEVKQTVDEINLLGRQSIGLRMDVSIKSDIVKGVDQVLEKFGKIDILVNAAGICPSSMLIDLEEKIWNQVINVNTKSVFLQQTLLEKVPLGRMAQPKEIGELIAFLASDQSAYITGEAVLIAGGKEMQ